MSQKNSALIKTKTFLTVVISLIAIFSLASCKSTQYSKNKLTLSDLKDRMDEFKDHYVAKTNEAAHEVRMSLKSKKMNIKILEWQTNSIDALNALSVGKDPMASLIDIWLLCERQKNYLKNPNVLIGINKEKFLIYDDLLDEIKLIANDFLTPKLVVATEKLIKQEAAARPINPGNLNFVINLSTKKQKSNSPITAALTLPLAPFEAMRGVDKGAIAMHDISLSAKDLSNIIEDLPRQVRWQFLLACYEIQEMESVKSGLASFEKLADSSDNISNQLTILPEKIGKETRLTLEETEKIQPQLQETLDKTTVATKEINQALVHLDDAAKSTTELVRIFSPEEKDNIAIEENTKESQEPSTIKQINDLTIEIGKSAKIINQATTEIKSLLQQEDLNAIDVIEKKFEKLTDHIFYRISILIGSIFILAVTYRFIFKKNKQ